MKFVTALALAMLTGCTQDCKSSDKSSSINLEQSNGAKILESKTLVFLGDSLTAGYQLPPDKAFPHLVNLKLSKDGFDWQVINAGVSGDTSAGALARLDWVLQSKPAVVFVCLGANDGLRGLDLESTETNLRSIVERLVSENARVILAGMLLPANYGPTYRDAFELMYKRIAKENSLPFIPFLLEGIAMNREFVLEDGIHPNEKGHERIADAVYPVVKDALQKEIQP